MAQLTRKSIRRGQIVFAAAAAEERLGVPTPHLSEVVRAVESVARGPAFRFFELSIGKAMLSLVGVLPDWTYGPYQVRASRVLRRAEVPFHHLQGGWLRVDRRQGLLALNLEQQRRAAVALTELNSWSALEIYRTARRYEAGHHRGRSIYAAVVTLLSMESGLVRRTRI